MNDWNLSCLNSKIKAHPLSLICTSRWMTYTWYWTRVWLLCWFPSAAVTSYQLDDLKQYNFIILQFWRTILWKVSLGWNQGIGRATFLLEALGKNPLPWHSRLWRMPEFLSWWPPSISSNPVTASRVFLRLRHSDSISNITSPSLTLTLQPPSFTYRDTRD